MSEFEAYRGIFIQSNETSEDFIEDCISELQPLCFSRIKTVVPNNTGTGIQMYFEDEKTVETLLNRTELVVSGKRYDICPLVTHLTLHRVIPRTVHDVKKKLFDTLQRYIGPILKIIQLPATKKYPDVGSANWRVISDIPEFEALQVFQNLKKKNETGTEFFYTEAGLKLSFFCPKCKEDGHISQRCKMLFKRRIKPIADKPSVMNTRSNTSFQKDAVASTSAASNYKIRGQTSCEPIGQPGEACSSWMDKPSKRKSEDVQNTLRHYFEILTSSSQAVTTPPTRNIHSSLPVKSESQNPWRRNSVIGEIRILPNSRTEECIQNAGGTCRLSLPQLENFFNHVKGKKDILRILKMYQNMHKISEKELRQQLNEIVRLYYVSKLPETKEDKSLIRWLEYLIERLNKKRREFNKRESANLAKKIKREHIHKHTHTYT
ncbi:hypothetical protein X975_20031, partial [Stegodyphus mimosarum]